MDNSFLNLSSKIYIAGHTGLIGSAFVRHLTKEGYRHVITRNRSDLNLTNESEVESFFQHERPDNVVLAAGRVGGIADNQAYPADYITENLAMELNVIRSAHDTGVHRLILFGSSCMYPRECSQPMSEDQLLSGSPEPTSIAYAVAKIAGVQLCLSYNQQYGEKRFLPVIPNSVFGPNDNFDPKRSHVLSALVRRFHEAKANHVDVVTLWGTGQPRRELVYVDDIVDACLHLLQRDISTLEFPLNIGVGSDMSIRELAETVAEVVGYTGQLEWDSSKPDGVSRKLLDSTRLKGFGWEPKVSFEEGLQKTCEWYVQNSHRISAHSR